MKIVGYEKAEFSEICKWNFKGSVSKLQLTKILSLAEKLLEGLERSCLPKFPPMVNVLLPTRRERKTGRFGADWRCCLRRIPGRITVRRPIRIVFVASRLVWPLTLLLRDAIPSVIYACIYPHELCRPQ